MQTTLDGLLNRRVQLEQPATGYRVAVDTIFLAAAIPAQPGEHVLDLGAGVGGAILCLAARVPNLTGLGLEIQPDLGAILRRNIHRNAFAAGLTAHEADATQFTPAAPFDHALMNPPYHEESRHDLSPNSIKQTANTEKTGDLALWINAAARSLKPAGTLTLIHRADRELEILAALRPAFGEIETLPLLPKPGEPAKRILIRARKSAAQTLRACNPIILHKPEGGYTPQADEILRNAKPLQFL